MFGVDRTFNISKGYLTECVLKIPDLKRKNGCKVEPYINVFNMIHFDAKEKTYKEMFQALHDALEFSDPSEEIAFEFSGELLLSTDEEKSLINACQKVFKNCRIFRCCEHLRKNIKSLLP